MPIDVTCSCGRSFSVPDALAGRSRKCKGCGRPMKIPAGGGPDGPASLLETDIDIPSLAAEAEAAHAEASASLLLAEPGEAGGDGIERAAVGPPALGDGVWEEIAQEERNAPAPASSVSPPPPQPPPRSPRRSRATRSAG
jgi:hypothetical protein